MKGIPSNRMPKYVEPNGGMLGYLILAAFICGLGYVAWSVAWYLTAGVVAGVMIITIQDRRNSKRIAAERIEESLCTFARSFDCRFIDTWIIRAVYEQVSPLVDFPIRKTDRFDKELDLDDALGEIAEEIAQRTGRSLTHSEQNPWYSKVETLEDMVMFFSCQPKQASG